MKRTFEIHNSIALKSENFYFDLHNCFDVESVELKIYQESNLFLTLKKSKGDWVSKEEVDVLVLQFEGISYLEYNSTLLNSICSTIEEIGFKDVEDYDYNWILSEEQSQLQSHIFFRFENDNYLRIYCDNITVHISNQ